MKKSLLLAILLILQILSCSSRDTIFVLKPQSVMSITGKGIGQDATINPYLGEDCLVIIKSLSDNPFVVRVEGKQLSEYKVTVEPRETITVDLLKEQVLYLDALSKASKAKVVFKQH